MSDDPLALLESARIQWRRDWDALAMGFVLGALAVIAAWGWIGEGFCAH